MSTNDQYAGKWCWAPAGAEDYQDGCDTESEAHGEAKSHMIDEHPPGAAVKYSIARVVHPLDLISDRSMARFAESLVESICEAAYDECGGEDEAIVLDAENAAVLSTMVKEFLRLRAAVQRHGVKDEVEHDYVVGSP